MALAIWPFTWVYIPCVETVDTVALPHPLPILTSISTSSCPGLNTIAIIFPINPITFISTALVEVVYTTAWAPALIELTLIDVSIAVCLHAIPRCLALAWPSLVDPRCPGNRWVATKPSAMSFFSNDLDDGSKWLQAAIAKALPALTTEILRKAPWYDCSDKQMWQGETYRDNECHKEDEQRCEIEPEPWNFCWQPIKAIWWASLYTPPHKWNSNKNSWG